MEDDEKLLPCPFCGGAAEIFEVQETDNQGGYVAGCKECEASSRVWFPLKDDVSRILREAWNQRVALSSPPEGWQPIETLRPDGDPEKFNCLVSDGKHVWEAWYDRPRDMFFEPNAEYGDEYERRLYPTHWMPLPSPSHGGRTMSETPGWLRDETAYPRRLLSDVPTVSDLPREAAMTLHERTERLLTLLDQGHAADDGLAVSVKPVLREWLDVSQHLAEMTWESYRRLEMLRGLADAARGTEAREDDLSEGECLALVTDRLTDLEAQLIEMTKERDEAVANGEEWKEDIARSGDVINMLKAKVQQLEADIKTERERADIYGNAVAEWRPVVQRVEDLEKEIEALRERERKAYLAGYEQGWLHLEHPTKSYQPVPAWEAYQRHQQKDGDK